MAESTHLERAVPGDAHPRESDVVSVTFRVPSGFAERHAELVGEFTSWTPLAMDRTPAGEFVATVMLRRGNRWGYQFVLDDSATVNDPAARAFAPSANGGHMSVIECDRSVR